MSEIHYDLCFACAKGDLNEVIKCVEFYKLDIDCTWYKCYEHFDSFYGSYGYIEDKMNKIFQYSGMNYTDKNLTPLQIAEKYGHARIVEYLRKIKNTNS